MQKPEPKPPVTIFLANPRGFCAGVERAIEIVEKSLEKYGAPVYVRHEIVHNQHVLNDLRSKGAIFVTELDEVPDDMPVVFSAHGVPKSVPNAAEARKMTYIDATCPLVSKVHRESELHFKRGHHVILIGHKGHPEVVGTMGQVPPDAMSLIETVEDAQKTDFSAHESLAYVTQTTLSVDDTADIIAVLKSRYPDIQGPKKEDICYATTNRQSAVKDIAEKVDVMLVVGAHNSSNSNRLVEVAKNYGADKAFLVADKTMLPFNELDGIKAIGITAGASAPESLVQGILDTLSDHFDCTLKNVVTATEDITFNLPRHLVA